MLSEGHVYLHAPLSHLFENILTLTCRLSHKHSRPKGASPNGAQHFIACMSHWRWRLLGCMPL